MAADFVGVCVVVTRPMMMHGKAHAAGEVLRLAPADAAAAVGSGRARLQNPGDRAVCDDALRTEQARVMASCGRPPAELLRFGGRRY